MKKKSRADHRKRAKSKSGGKAAPTRMNQIALTPTSTDCAQVERVFEMLGEFVPYDENLLERARTQWQFGDWQGLAALDRSILQHHPDRAKLALLAAAGHIQLGDISAARQFTRLAQDWGSSKKLLSQILIAGVHNTLGRAAAVSGQQPRAFKHFENAIAIGSPDSEVRLITLERMDKQLVQLGLPSTNSHTKVGDIGQINKDNNERNIVSAGKSKSSNVTKISADADVDLFVKDIYPFFYGKKITYVDVGAFEGSVFLAFMRNGLAIREAHLFEPNNKSFKKLSENVSKAKTRKKLYNLALLDEPGMVQFLSSGSMTKLLNNSSVQNYSSESFVVHCEILDNLADIFTDRHIHLLKVDVEGSELAFLNGAKSLLQSQAIDVIYIEAGFSDGNTQQTNFEDIKSFLTHCDYHIFKFYEQKNQWINNSPLLRRANVAFMSKAFADANPLTVVHELFSLKAKYGSQ